MDYASQTFLMRYLTGREVPAAHLSYIGHYVVSEKMPDFAAGALPAMPPFYKKLLIGGESIAGYRLRHVLTPDRAPEVPGLVTGEFFGNDRKPLGVYTHVCIIQFPSRDWHYISMVSARGDVMKDQAPVRTQALLYPGEGHARVISCIAAGFPAPVLKVAELNH